MSHLVGFLNSMPGLLLQAQGVQAAVSSGCFEHSTFNTKKGAVFSCSRLDTICFRGQPTQKSYKTFMMALADDVTPEEAQKQYDAYLTAFFGSERKAKFQTLKERKE